mmetsp:Transcript_28364/g.52018  ORF Transcript_28364/g.52018 Transcript_28364/m.52018 type:complete len:147 (+) Transcript_28364:85-525(+)
MQKVAIVLSCLACAGLGQRMQSSLEQSEDTRALARFLLAANAASGFNPSVPGARSPSLRPKVSEVQSPVMRMSDEEVNQKVLASAAAVATALAPYAALADGLIPEGNDITPQFIFLNLVGLTIGFGPPLLLAAEFFKQAKTGKFDR